MFLLLDLCLLSSCCASSISMQVAGLAKPNLHHGGTETRRHGDTEKIGDRKKPENLPRMGADKRRSEEIAKIAELPKSPKFHPSKPKPGLPGTPELPKIAEIGSPLLFTSVVHLSVFLRVLCGFDFCLS